MTGLLKVSQHRSQAVSLAVTALPVTLPAALLYMQQGTELPWLTIVSLIVGRWVGTDIGARLANRVSPDKLRVVLMIVIAGMAVFMAYKRSAERAHTACGTASKRLTTMSRLVSSTRTVMAKRPS
jgi:uncharacterized membrane protein YfcA